MKEILEEIESGYPKYYRQILNYAKYEDLLNLYFFFKYSPIWIYNKVIGDNSNEKAKNILAYFKSIKQKEIYEIF